MKRSLDQTGAWLTAVSLASLIFGVSVYAVVKLAKGPAKMAEAHAPGGEAKEGHGQDPAHPKKGHGDGPEEHSTAQHESSSDKELKADEPEHAAGHDPHKDAKESPETHGAKADHGQDGHEAKATHEGGEHEPEKKSPEEGHHGSSDPSHGDPIEPASKKLANSHDDAAHEAQKKSPNPTTIRVKQALTIGAR